MLVIAGRNMFAAVELLADDSIGDPWFIQNLAHSGSRFGVNVQHAVDDVAAFAGEQPENPPGSPNDLLGPVGNADARDGKLWGVRAYRLGIRRITSVVSRAALRLAIIIGQEFSSRHRREVVGGLGTQQFAGIVARSWRGCKQLVRIVCHAGNLPGETA